jgi:hypothetical protein
MRKHKLFFIPLTKFYRFAIAKEKARKTTSDEDKSTTTLDSRCNTNNGEV